MSHSLETLKDKAMNMGFKKENYKEILSDTFTYKGAGTFNLKKNETNLTPSNNKDTKHSSKLDCDP